MASIEFKSGSTYVKQSVCGNSINVRVNGFSEQSIFSFSDDLSNTYSMEQPDLYHKNDVTNLVKFCMENTSRRRVFSLSFD